MGSIVFGPITSRRFGQSLGIDLSPDKKQCNFDCLYCELKGAKVVDKAYDVPSVYSIIKELREALKKHTSLDVITLTANGEPTLYPHLQELIHEIRHIKSDTKLLILSNGSTIVQPKIRHILSSIDIVKLSLDCVSPMCFKKLDRAHKSIEIENIIEGMKVFRANFSGEMVLEILVVKGLNDTDAEFRLLNHVLQTIAPNRVDVGTIDRPPAYEVKGVSVERLLELSGHLKNVHVNIAYSKNYIPQRRAFSKEEIVELLKRRPQSFEDIKLCFDAQSQHIIDVLLEEKILHVKKIAGVNFYTCG